MNASDTTPSNANSKYHPMLPVELWGEVLRHTGLYLERAPFISSDDLFYSDPSIMKHLRRRKKDRTAGSPACHILLVSKLFYSEGLRWLYKRPLNFGPDMRSAQILEFLNTIGSAGRNRLRSMMIFGPPPPSWRPPLNTFFDRMCDTYIGSRYGYDGNTTQKRLVEFLMEELNLKVLRVLEFCKFGLGVSQSSLFYPHPNEPLLPRSFANLTPSERSDYNNHLTLVRGVAEGKVEELQFALMTNASAATKVYKSIEARFAPFIRFSSHSPSSMTSEDAAFRSKDMMLSGLSHIVLRKGKGVQMDSTSELWKLIPEEEKTRRRRCIGGAQSSLDFWNR